MRRNRSSSAGLAAVVLGVSCAVLPSACLNPIPDDFPNGDGRHVEEDREAPPDTVVPGVGSGGVSPGAPASQGPDDEHSAPAESPASDGDSPSGGAPDAGADVGSSDAGAPGGGTGGGG